MAGNMIKIEFILILIFVGLKMYIYLNNTWIVYALIY